MVEFKESPYNDRESFSSVFNSDRYNNYDEYIDMMRRDSTFGDHLTLQAISELFFVRIHVVSSEACEYDRTIVPREDAENIPTVTVGYYPEGNGEHYVSVQRADFDFTVDRE